MTPDEMKARWKEIEKHKDVLGWSLQTLGLRLGLNMAQITGVKAGKKTISNSDLNWLAVLADHMQCIPRPTGSHIAGEEFKEPAMPTNAPYTKPETFMPVQTGPTEETTAAFQTPPFAQTIAEADRDDRADPNEAIIRALALQFVEIEKTGLTALQEEGAAWALGGIAATLGIVDQVRAAVKALRAEAGTAMSRGTAPVAYYPSPHSAATASFGSIDYPAPADDGARVPM